MATMTHHVISARHADDKPRSQVWIPVCSCGWEGPGARRKNTALRDGTIHHGTKANQPSLLKCPTPAKKRFRSQQAAEKELELFWRTAGKGQPMPCRTYLCECGRWHTTARPLRKP